MFAPSMPLHTPTFCLECQFDGPTSAWQTLPPCGLSPLLISLSLKLRKVNRGTWKGQFPSHLQVSEGLTEDITKLLSVSRGPWTRGNGLEWRWEHAPWSQGGISDCGPVRYCHGPQRKALCCPPPSIGLPNPLGKRWSL